MKAQNQLRPAKNAKNKGKRRPLCAWAEAKPLCPLEKREGKAGLLDCREARGSARLTWVASDLLDWVGCIPAGGEQKMCQKTGEELVLARSFKEGNKMDPGNFRTIALGIPGNEHLRNS